MASYIRQLQSLAFLSCLMLWSAQSDQQCPAGCVCKDFSAYCTALDGIKTPFPDNTRSVSISDCNDKISLGGGLFGMSVEVVRINKCSVKDIGPYTFTNLPYLKELNFTDVFIDNVLRCAFHYLHGSAAIIFKNAHIKRIETGAFSEMSGLERIVISLSVVDNTQPYAFYNIQVRNFTIFDSSFYHVSSLTFHSISEVELVWLHRIVGDVVQDLAFSNISKVDRATVDHSRFNRLQCHALTSLREATPAGHDTFVFTNSTLQCNCFISPIVSYQQAHGNFLTNTVLCADPTDSRFSQFKSQPVAVLTMDKLRQVCPGQDLSKERCPPVQLDPPACYANISTTTSTADLVNVTTAASTEGQVSSVDPTPTVTLPDCGVHGAAQGLLVISIAFIPLYL